MYISKTANWEIDKYIEGFSAIPLSLPKTTVLHCIYTPRKGRLLVLKNKISHCYTPLVNHNRIFKQILKVRLLPKL